MQAVERIPRVPVDRKRNCLTYLADTLLGIIGSLFITGLIVQARLYPTIPDIMIVYLLWIVVLAVFRSRISAVVASLTAVLSFDWFLVQPLYTFFRNSLTNYVMLAVFLITALVVGQLAGTVRRKAEELRLRERRFQILYELLRVYNNTRSFDEQMDIIALSTMRIFSAFGASCVAVLLPDEDDIMRVRGDAPIQVDSVTIAPDIMRSVDHVYRRGGIKILPRPGDPDGRVYLVPLRLIPTHSQHKTLGVMYIETDEAIPWLRNEETFRCALAQDASYAEFFWTYVEQVANLIERSLDPVHALPSESSRLA